jgi:methionyl aminopeptidase
VTTPPKSNDPCWCGSGRKYKRCHKSGDGGSVAAGAAHILERAARAGSVRPGLVTPRRPVPADIARPDYALTGTPGRGSGRLVKTEEEIARLRRACHAAAEILEETGQAVAPGVTTDHLDVVCHDACIRHGGYPSPLNYHGYPKSICTSVNEVICHGIPDSRPLGDGEIVNLDVTIYLDGVHGDTNATYAVGDTDAASLELIQVTRECLQRAIAVVGPAVPMNEIGRAIQTHAEAHGFGVVRSFVGHGIGDSFHMAPQVPHYFDPRMTTRMQTGWVFTIEPMITMGDWHHRMWDDDWTAVTADLSRTAQFEHTVLVTEHGADVLTAVRAEV